MSRGFDPARLSFPRFAALFAALLALASLPLFTSGVLPLVDYPNHLARMQLLASLPDSPLLQQFYSLAWRPIPNLAMDLVVPPLLRILPLEVAGKIFVLASFLLLAGGAATLNRVLFGRWSAWPCLAFLLLYGRLLLWGILNYLFGLGLAIAALAGWIALAERPAPVRLLAGAVFAFAVFFAHLMAFGVYGVLVLGYEAGRLRHRRRSPGGALAALAIAALPLALPIVVMLIGGGGESGGRVSFSHPWRKLDLLFSIFDLYHRPFDVACFVLAGLGLGLAHWRRWLVLAPAMAVPLAALSVVYLAMPTQLLTASGADRRLPLALFLVLCGGSAWVAAKPRLERIYLGAAAVMFVLRLATVGQSWEASGREYTRLLAGLDAVPLGSRIAVAYPEAAVSVVATPLVHLPVLAAARRQAFVTTLFAYAGQQPIALQPSYRAVAAQLSPDLLWAVFVGGRLTLDPAAQAALARCDYVLFTDRQAFAPANLQGLEPVFRTPQFQLYRLKRGGDGRS